MVHINNIFLIHGIVFVIVINSIFAQRKISQCLHHCPNGRCILDDYICDGISDCSDNSDELNCPRNVDASGCIVPELPKNGYFLSESTNISAKSGDILPESTALVLKCNSQHSMKTFCKNSQWSADLKCPSMCPQLRLQSTVTAACSINNGTDNQCDHPQLEGTVARFTCKPGYEAELLDGLQCNGSTWEGHGKEGSTWEGKMPKCKRSNWKDTCVLPPKIKYGRYTVGLNENYTPGDIVSDVTVLIYQCYPDYTVDGDGFSYCVNGTWDPSPKCLRFCDPLASGTVFFFCLSPSSTIGICEGRQPSGTVVASHCMRHFSPDAPLVRLRCNDGVWDKPLPKCSIQSGFEFPSVLIPGNHSDQVGPCVMPENPPNGKFIAGANRDISPGEELPDLSVLFIECSEGYGSGDKKDYIFCDGANQWPDLNLCQKMCPPLIVPHVEFECESNIPETEACLKHMKHGTIAKGYCKPSFFSDSIIPDRTCLDGVWDKPPPVCKPKQWGQYIPIATNGRCVLPDHNVDGQYIYSKNAEITTGDVVPESSIITHACNDGYEFNGLNLSFCHNGSWKNIPKCLKTCAPLISIAVNLTCRHGGAIVNCMEPLKNGTTVESKCKESYSPSVPVLPLLVCINGNWDKEPPKCNPECGTITSQGQKYIVNGSSTELGEFPWHVGLYDKTRNYQQICGGSVINAILVVTAAHCVWDKHGQRSASDYAVAGVKYYREWNSDGEDKNLVQRSSIAEIVLPYNYGGDAQRQQADIALLTLKTPFKFTSFIRLVCLDWDISVDKLHLSPGNIGKVTGWGLTDVTNADSASPVLLTLRMPYVDYKQCRKETSAFATYLGVDKICAGYKNEGTTVCKGDSGGGLVFESFIHDIERWYLRGIVSVGPKDELNPDTCHSEMYTGFTHVLSHADWLKQEIYKRTPY